MPVYDEYEVRHGNEDALLEDKFGTLKQFMLNFTSRYSYMCEGGMRQVFVEYAGPYYDLGGRYAGFQLIHDFMNFTDPISSHPDLFKQRVETLVASGGTTATAAAIDFVREEVLTNDTYRPGSVRIVILGTDGAPTDLHGMDSDEEDDKAEEAVRRIKVDDDVFFVFLKFGDDYREEWFKGVADAIYDTSFVSLGNLLDEQFLCFPI